MEADGSSGDSRDLLRSESVLKQQKFDSEAPTDPGVGDLSQDQDQTDEDMESTSDHEEVLGSSVRRRFSCDGDALQEEQEQVHFDFILPDGSGDRK